MGRLRLRNAILFFEASVEGVVLRAAQLVVDPAGYLAMVLAYGLLFYRLSRSGE